MRKVLLTVLFICCLCQVILADLNTGLIAYYPFNGDANDVSGNGNDATAYNDYEYLDGVSSDAIRLVGSGHTGLNGGHVILPTIALNEFPAFTISMWVYHQGNTSPLNHGERFIGFGDPSQGDIVSVLSNGGFPGDTLDWVVGNGQVSIPYGEDFGNNWQHLVLRADNGELTAFLNGESVGTDSYQLGSISSVAGLGCSWFSGGNANRFIGMIDEVYIYNQAISQYKILLLYNGFSVQSPNGGEELIAGQTETITWESARDISFVSIDYSSNNGYSWQEVDPNTPNDGEYDWTVPDVTSNQCLVKVSDATDPNVSDTSDEVFAIYVCQLDSWADRNNDCIVSLPDFGLFALEWLRIGNPLDPGFTEIPEGFSLIGGGEFLMGDHHDGSSNALPVHAVYVDLFYMNKYEVTNQKYCDYLNAVKLAGQLKVVSNKVYASDDAGNSFPYCDTHDGDADSQINYSMGVFSVNIKDGTDMSNHPMVQVSFYGAAAYCNYYGYRLPTEAEWECAARGGEYTPYYRYPWGGDSLNGSNANYYNSGDPYQTGNQPWTTPVGYYDGGQIPAGADMANGYGLYDMVGNVWEWCSDWYDAAHYGVSPYDNPQGPGSSTHHVLRSSHWLTFSNSCQLSNRINGRPEYLLNNLGFRVVKDLE